MKIVIFGLTVSSSWGNGHATLWRALIAALTARGHRVVFFEKDVAYYAGHHRDLHELRDGELLFYNEFGAAAEVARCHLADADVGMVTSYCPDGRAASEMVLSSPAKIRAFYDLDTPVTLANLEAGQVPAYLPEQGLGDFDLVLSYTGGRALEQLGTMLGARRVAPLYGHVGPAVHRPVEPVERYRADLSYLGTYAADRQSTLEQLFIEPARVLRDRRFLIGGAQYPADFPWTSNIYFVRHMPPPQHPDFFCSSRLTLNVTRRAMAEYGFCPSGRLFEAAACGAPVLTDWWEGLETFFDPWREVLVARSSAEAIAAIEMSDAALRRMAVAARERTLSEHTSARRAADFEAAVNDVMTGAAARDAEPTARMGG